MEPHPPTDAGGDRNPGLDVIAAGSLADVVQERRDEQEIRPGDPRRQDRGSGRRLQQVPVDGEVVKRSRLRE
jgi:hypothetical protein